MYVCIFVGENVIGIFIGMCHYPRDIVCLTYQIMWLCHGVIICVPYKLVVCILTLFVMSI